MSHKDAPPPTPEQMEVEAFYIPRLAARGAVVGWGRAKDGSYLSIYAQDALAAWIEARKPRPCIAGLLGELG